MGRIRGLGEGCAVLSLAALCACGGAGSGGGPLFSEQTEVSVAAPQLLVARDLDGDGAADLVVGRSAAEDPIAVLPGRGDGTFGEPAFYAPGGLLRELAVADLDGDGHPDVACSARESRDSNVHVLPGDGDGGLEAAVSSAAEGIPTELAVADFDADGHLDVALGQSSDARDSITFRPGLGDGTFGEPTAVPAGVESPEAVTAADFDADGHQDVAAASLRDDTVVVFRGAGDGTFSEAKRLAISNANVVRAGDLDADGLPDLVVKGAGAVFVARGLGGADFAEPAAYATETAFAGDLVLADFDGDGHLDAAVNDGISDLVHVLSGAGDGTLETARSFEAPDDPTDVAAADFDADGHPDLAVARQDAGAVTLHLTARD